MNDTRPDQDHPDDRAAAAFRGAMSDLRTAGRLDPEAAMRTARRRRTAAGVAGGLALALIVAAGAIGIPGLVRPDQQVAPAGTPTAAQPTILSKPDSGLPDDSAPSGWRTEQYRDLTFQVPDAWGYAFEPGPDWCAQGKSGTAKPTRPYVALGGPQAVLDIHCGPMPDDLIVEHVAAVSSADRKAEGRNQLGRGFWEVTRTFGAVTLRAVSTDPDLAQRIVDTGAPAGADALCAPSSPMQTDRDARPEPSDITEFEDVSEAALCQYEGPDPVGLRAATSVSGAEARQLVEDIARRPRERADASCGEHDRRGLEVSVVIRVATGDRIEEIFLRLNGCSDGNVYFGGFDDGTAVRTPDRATCRAVMRPPLLIQSGGAAVHTLCARPR